MIYNLVVSLKKFVKTCDKLYVLNVNVLCNSCGVVYFGIFLYAECYGKCLYPGAYF